MCARATKRAGSSGRACARCGAKFNDDMAFITCPGCRHPVVDDGGGCHWWEGANEDPRTNKDTRVSVPSPKRRKK